MDIKVCLKCGVFGAGLHVEGVGVTTCRCLPAGKTCKDCKFESQCLIEGKITRAHTICQVIERGFAEPGQLTFKEKYEQKIAEDAKNRPRKSKKDLSPQVPRWTKELIIKSRIPSKNPFSNIPGLIEVTADPSIPEPLRKAKSAWEEDAATRPNYHSQYRGTCYIFLHEEKLYKLSAPLVEGKPLCISTAIIDIRMMLWNAGCTGIRFYEGEYVPFEYQREGRYDSVWFWQHMYRAKTEEEAAERFLDEWVPGWEREIGERIPLIWQSILGLTGS